MTSRDSTHTTGIFLVLFLSLANFNCQTGAIPNNSGPNNSGARSLEGGSALTYGYEVVNTWPHDTEAYTQGLVFWDGKLLESTGLEGKSSLRRIEFETGRVLQKVNRLFSYGGSLFDAVGNLEKRFFQITPKGIVIVLGLVLILLSPLAIRVFRLGWRRGLGVAGVSATAGTGDDRVLPALNEAACRRGFKSITGSDSAGVCSQR